MCVISWVMCSTGPDSIVGSQLCVRRCVRRQRLCPAWKLTLSYSLDSYTTTGYDPSLGVKNTATTAVSRPSRCDAM